MTIIFGVFLLTFLLITAVAIHLCESPLMGAGVGGALAVAAWRFWVPVRFEISSNHSEE